MHIYFLRFVYLFIHFMKKFIGSVSSELISLSNSWRSERFVLSREMVLKIASLHKLLQIFRVGLFWHLFVIYIFSGANGRERPVLQMTLQPKICCGQHVLWSKSVREWLQRQSISVIFHSCFLIEHCGCLRKLPHFSASSEKVQALVPQISMVTLWWIYLAMSHALFQA